jgi:hypothetical protein
MLPSGHEAFLGQVFADLVSMAKPSEKDINLSIEYINELGCGGTVALS